MHKSRIVVLHFVNSFSIGGAEALASTIACRLPKDKFECHVCALFEINDPKTAAVIMEKFDMAGVRYHELNKKRHRLSFSIFGKLRRIVHRIKADIVHSHCISPDLHSAIALCFSSRVHLLRTLHSTEYAFSTPMKLAAKLLRWRFTATVAISHDVLKWGLNEGLNQKKLVSIVNGVDVAQIAQAVAVKRSEIAVGVKKSTPLLVSVGRMDSCEAKGFKYLLNAFAQLLNSGVDFHAILVGHGVKQQEYQELSQKLGLQSHVSFLGRRHDVPGILKACDIFVLASIREGFGLVVCEAGVGGLPVIATRIPGIVSVIDDGVDGILVTPQSPEELCAAMKELLTNRVRAVELGKTFQKKVASAFTIERVVEEHGTLYEQLVNK